MAIGGVGFGDYPLVGAFHPAAALAHWRRMPSGPGTAEPTTDVNCVGV
jgi:hypothetical protein